MTLRRIDISNARAVITGAAGGLGDASARVLRARGVKVIGIDCKEVGKDILCCDVTDMRTTIGAVAEAAGLLGGIDILINCAGIGLAHDAATELREDLRRIVEVNLFGTWNVTSAAVPYLLRGHGHVINISSGIAVLAMPYGAAYCASKRAVSAYSDVLRLEYRNRLTVTTMYPGFLRTHIHDRNVAQGYSIEGVVPADTLDGAARAMVRACEQRPREAYTSRTTEVSLRLARVFPRLFEWGLQRRLEACMRNSPPPAFLRHQSNIGSGDRFDGSARD